MGEEPVVANFTLDLVKKWLRRKGFIVYTRTWEVIYGMGTNDEGPGKAGKQNTWSGFSQVTGCVTIYYTGNAD